MPDTPLHVLSVLPLSDAQQARIRAVAPRIRLHVLSDGARRRFRAPDRQVDDPEAADAEIHAALGRAPVLFTLASQYRPIPADSAVEWLHVASAGVDRVLRQGVPEGIRITNSRGMHATPIAEWVLATILMQAKRMPTFLTQQQDGVWKRQDVALLRNATVGVLGLGKIGEEVARLCDAFGARVIGTRRHAETAPPPHVAAVYGPEDLDAVLRASDYVVVCLPLTPETRGLLTAERLRAMRPDGVLINIARGEIVDWTAMLAALRDGAIGAVYTDVTVPEPLPPDDPAWRTPHLYITPHNSGVFPDYNERATDIFVDELTRYVRGEPPARLVDRTLGY